MLKSKSQILREDMISALRLKSEIDTLEHYLDRVFNNVHRDQMTLRKYLNVLVTRLNRYHHEDLAKLNRDEIKSKNKSSTGLIGPTRSGS